MLILRAARSLETAVSPSASIPLTSTKRESVPGSVCPRSFAAVRLRRHAEYQLVYRQGRKENASLMSYFFRLRPAGEVGSSSLRIGLTAGRVLGKANERNRIKRRMREACRLHLDLLSPALPPGGAGIDLVLHPRRAVLDAEFARVEADVVRVFERVAKQAAAMAVTPATNARPEPDTKARRESLGKHPCG